MPEEKDKTFDLNRPGHISPHASGRPVIVGHHPVMADPMLRPMHHNQPMQQPVAAQPLVESQPPAMPQPSQPPAPVPQSHQPQPVYQQPTTAPATGFEPIGEMLPQQQTPGMSPQVQQTPSAHMAHHELPISDHHKKGFSLRKLLLWVILPLIALVILFYLLIDSGVINSNVKLPYYFFKKTTVTTNRSNSEQSGSNSTKTTDQNPVVPTGFSAYDDSALPFTFNYPTIWGTPTVVTEQGYSKRGGSNKADGTYAYLVNFATNKEVQLAVTSSKYLPPARGILYYDFLGWCLSQTDSKYYKSILTFTTVSGVDTPGAVTCNQGPLTDASVVDASTIVQRGTKAADGASLGDVYTKNLSSTDIPVVRVKDATGKNGDNIKIILNTNQASGTSTP